MGGVLTLKRAVVIEMKMCCIKVEDSCGMCFFFYCMFVYGLFVCLFLSFFLSLDDLPTKGTRQTVHVQCTVFCLQYKKKTTYMACPPNYEIKGSKCVYFFYFIEATQCNN